MSASSPVFILSAGRTPIGKFCGMFKEFSAVELGAHAIRGVLHKARIPARDVEEVIMGQVLQAGAGQNPARQAALKAGIPSTVAAFTVNKCCGSGLKAVLLAAQAVKAGDGDLFVAGGMESMSQAPYLLEKLRGGMRLGHGEIMDSILTDGLLCPTCDWHMGHAAEFIAKKYKVSRKDQDRFALLSHRNAVAAREQGLFKDEILPVPVKRDGKTVLLEHDEGPREDTNLDLLGKLPSPFKPGKGTVTAGNAPGLNDGAAAVIVCSERYLRRRPQSKPIAKILDYVTVGTHPKHLFVTPALAAQALLKKMGASWKDFDLLEVNEAFAAAALASGKIAKWDPERVNVHGGSIAFGHPLGTSGARILTTLVHALRARGLRRGMASICMGGGNGLAAAIELQ